MVSARDFVYVSKKGYNGNVFVMGGKSVDFKDAPNSNKIVRYEIFFSNEIVKNIFSLQGYQWTRLSDGCHHR